MREGEGREKGGGREKMKEGGGIEINSNDNCNNNNNNNKFMTRNKANLTKKIAYMHTSPQACNSRCHWHFWGGWRDRPCMGLRLSEVGRVKTVQEAECRTQQKELLQAVPEPIPLWQQ